MNENGDYFETDAVIIGAGPVGLFAVFELGLLDVRAHLIDILDRPGGQCTELYPEKPIYDIPGYPVIEGQELVERLMEQIAPFGPVFHFSQMASSLTKLENGNWLVETDAGNRIEARVVVVAAGGGSFMPKKPNLQRLEEFEGRSVFYAVKKREQFAGKRVLIAGGGDSAVDWALSLHGIAKSVSIVHRRPDFRAAPGSVARMKALAEKGEISLHVGNITSLNGDNGIVSSAGFQAKGCEREEIECDAVLFFYGLTMKPGPIADFGLDMHENLVCVDTEKFETSVAGVFAVGDINWYPGKLKLILSGFHEAALMAQKAFAYVHAGRRYRFQYTTSSSDLHEKLGVSESK